MTQLSDPMAYLPDMEQIDPSVRLQVTAAYDGYDGARYTAADARRALLWRQREPLHAALHLELLRELLRVLRV